MMCEKCIRIKSQTDSHTSLPDIAFITNLSFHLWYTPTTYNLKHNHFGNYTNITEILQ